MANPRRFIRYTTQLEAQFYCKGQGREQQFIIFDVCRKGMGIIFHINKEIKVGTTIRLEIPNPKSFETINVSRELRWFRKEESEFIGAIELSTILSPDEVAKLSYAHTSYLIERR